MISNEIINIFIIQHNTGLILGSYSKNKAEKHGDKDIFSGMLTTIRSFGEDAFNKSNSGQQHSEIIIDYDNYKILLQNHYNYYFAVVLEGSLSIAEKNKLTNKLYNFTKKNR